MDFLKLACARARYLGLEHGDHLDRRGRADLSAAWTSGTSSARCTTRSKATSIRPASRTRTRRPRAISAPRSTASRASRSSIARPDGSWDVVTDKGNLVRRARRQRRRAVGARSRAHGRPRAAGARDGAPVPHHRRDAGGGRLAEGSAARHRLRGRDLHAPGRPRHADRHLRERRRAVVRARDAVGFHARAAAARSRPHRAEPRSRLPAFPGARARGHQARRQRPVHVRARRQSADRADPRPAQLLGRLRRDGRLQPGRRRRPRARRTGWSTAIRASTSGRWTSRASATGRRRRTRNAKVRENYSRRFRIRFPNEELPAARPLRTTPVVRPAEGAAARCSARRTASSTRCGSRRRASEPREDVTYRRSNAHAPVGEECRAVREAVGSARDRELRALRGDGRRRARVARAHARQPAAARRAHRAVADAERRRQADRRLHGGQRRSRIATSSSAPASPSSITCAGSRRSCRASGVTIRSLRTEMLGFAIAGPNARELLRAC